LNVKIADVFLGFFLQFLQDYDSFIIGHSACGFHFQEDVFVKHFPETSQKFVNDLIQSQLFQCFLTEREQYIDHYTGTTFEQKLQMLSQLLKAKKRKGVNTKDSALLQVAINEIYGIVPSKLTVLANKIWG